MTKQQHGRAARPGTTGKLILPPSSTVTGIPLVLKAPSGSPAKLSPPREAEMLQQTGSRPTASLPAGSEQALPDIPPVTARLLQLPWGQQGVQTWAVGQQRWHAHGDVGWEGGRRRILSAEWEWCTTWGRAVSRTGGLPPLQTHRSARRRCWQN